MAYKTYLLFFTDGSEVDVSKIVSENETINRFFRGPLFLSRNMQ